MTKLNAKEKFETIKKANGLLIAKIDELKNYLETQSFNMGEKEINKYYNLKNNEKAILYKAEFEKKSNLLNERLNYEVSNLNNGPEAFLMGLVNYYAKVEDGYYEVLGISNNGNLNGGSLFKCEVALDYYRTNLQNIINLEQTFVANLNKLDEKSL